jgi:dynein heavy chain
VDPTDSIRKLAAEQGMGGRFFSVALGQGQAGVATKMIEEGVKCGHWVFLANCHLMTSWLPQLDKLVEGLQGGGAAHKDFRCGRGCAAAASQWRPAAAVAWLRAAPCQSRSPGS